MKEMEGLGKRSKKRKWGWLMMEIGVVMMRVYMEIEVVMMRAQVDMETEVVMMRSLVEMEVVMMGGLVEMEVVMVYQEMKDGWERRVQVGMGSQPVMEVLLVVEVVGFGKN